jgi:hypothetical protein
MNDKQQWLYAQSHNQAERLYTIAYKRWALELSHDKNVIIAKDISIFLANELRETTDDEFWSEVRKVLVENDHTLLYKP